jgi:heme exporter protein D
MNWSSWSDFAAMGGYAPYVWGSFGMAALAVVVELAQIGARRRALLGSDDEA